MNTASQQILLELENGIGRFASYPVSDVVRRHATKLLEGTADVMALWAQYAAYEQQGLVQGGPVRSKTASADKRFLARALRLMRQAVPACDCGRCCEEWPARRQGETFTADSYTAND